MTWAERVGDLATNVTLVALTTIRIVTELIRIATVAVDSLVTALGEGSESGLKSTEAKGLWLRLPGTVLLGAAMAILQFIAIFTVLARQTATTVNEFVRTLAETS